MESLKSLHEGDSASGAREAGPDPHIQHIDRWLEEVEQRGCENTSLLVGSLQWVQKAPCAIDMLRNYTGLDLSLRLPEY